MEQVIRVDAEHSHLVAEGAPSPPNYRLRAASSFILDTSNFAFSIPPQLASAGVNAPNSIQVVHGGNKGQYSLVWESGVSTYRISADSVRAARGAPAFPGLSPGETVIVAVGHLKSGGGAGWDNFYPFWVGMVDVQ